MATFPFLPNYQEVTEIYNGARTLVYRALRHDDAQPVILKLLRNAHPHFNELVKFRNQFVIARNLESPYIVRPLALERYDNSYLLVMPDQGGISLASYRQCQFQEGQGQQGAITSTKLQYQQWLDIAIQLAEALHYLSTERVVHKDIKPANILIHPKTGQVQLIDFSIASLLPKEQQQPINPTGLEGTLAYLAPEQTGRMNRGIDYRTDFYSLGITLYELLTGELPFQSSDPLELIHCHLTQLPPALNEVKPDIPPMVAAIAHKLMAKNAEDRYQSALGLKHDLQRCLTEWQTAGTITEFELGQQDISDRFLIPEKLYGRETEVQALLDAFQRVAAGASELMLVAGFSGIGKTAVINEVHKPIVRQRGYFVKGKFDQFNRNIPFSAWMQAFRSLMRQILSEADTALGHWKTKILEALDTQGRVLIEVIPELEQVIGPQPEVPELAGSAAQNRFNRLFEEFIAVFTTPEHPLTIFLDDLQWADPASLNLLRLLMGENQLGYLLLLGAYRDNEVFPAHPLMLTLGDLSQQQAAIATLTLAPLAEVHLNQLCAATLNCPPPLAQPLSALVFQKTQGNPFFATQFLQELYEDGLIRFDVALGQWQADLIQMQGAYFTDDVVQLVMARLQKLPIATQQVLKLAACIGNRFDLQMLAIVCERPAAAVATDLWRSLQETLIVPETETYKFFHGKLSDTRPDTDVTTSYRFYHDRVQQAAYGLIPEAEKAATHWQIGQLLLQQLSPQQQEEQLFTLVNHLNLGQTAIATQGDPAVQLAQFNCRAGLKAKQAAAHPSAQTYFETGIELLPATTWQTNYQLMYDLHRYCAEAAYLSGNFDRAEALYELAFNCAATDLDRAIIYRIQMTQYQLQGRNAEGIAIQQKSLAMLGWSMPTDPDKLQSNLDAEVEAVSQFLTQQTIESILDLPRIQDENVAEMLRILQILFYAAWLDGQPTLAMLALAKMTSLSLQYGNSDLSPFGYAGYGLIANTMLQDPNQAYAFGHMAVELCEQFDNADIESMTNFLFAADVHSWSHSLREADAYYDAAFEYGMAAGNWLTVGFTMMLSGSDRLTYGKNLTELYEIAQAHATFLQQVQSLENLDALVVGVLQPVRQLLGLTDSPLTLDDDQFSEAAYLAQYQDTPYHLAWFYSVKIRHAYLFEQQDLYEELITKLPIIEETVPTHAKVPSSVFYVTLMHLALYETATDVDEQQLHWQGSLALEEKLNHWSAVCPDNLHHKCLLIQAERARLNGEKAVAMDYYDQAIAQARLQKYEYEAALAGELASKFYLGWGKTKMAAVQLQEAYYDYSQWGAKAKIFALEARYPDLLLPITQSQMGSQNVLSTLTALAPATLTATQTAQGRTASHGLNATLDLVSILKASQALSRTIQLDELLQNLTQIILQNSGGDHCVLILPDETNTWQVRAIATAETTQLVTEPLTDHPNLPIKLIQYVKNTEMAVIIDGLETELPVIDAYFETRQPQSLAGLPILNQGKLIGLLIIQNLLTSGVFTNERMLILNFLCTQAAIALENARLYQQAQDYAQQVAQSQLQLVQSEKMATLGNLVAGVAHELNNPIGFLQGSIQNTTDYMEDLLGHLDLYEEEQPPNAVLQDNADTIDLAFLRNDLPKLVDSMAQATQRIRGISNGLRVFSRVDRREKVSADLHTGLDSTLLILKYRLKANDVRPAIVVTKVYGDLPPVKCFHGQLNQVFMNILANAIDAFDEANVGKTFAEIEAAPNQITIHTACTDTQVTIQIKDNGGGMQPGVAERIFEPGFTTKGVGKGTGLGMAIARQIVVETHGGALNLQSEVNQGTEFCICLPI